MPDAVFKVDRNNAAKINEVTSDEIVSRLSITTRDSNVLGVAGDCVYVILDGRQEGLDRAKELFEGKSIGRLAPTDVKNEVIQAFKAEEEAAAEGMGNLFL